MMQPVARPDLGDEPEQWMAASKRRGATRLLAVGIVLLVLGGTWGLVYWNDGVGASPITYVRVLTVLVVGIGIGITVAGGVLLARHGRGQSG
jgi:hypothetical protein